MRKNLLSELKKEAKALAAEYEAMMTSDYTYWRDENFDLIVEFAKEKYKFPVWPLREYQNETRRALFEEKILRILECWPRRAGKEYTTFEILIEAAITDPGLYLMVYPTNVKAKAILWDGYILLPDGTNLKFRDMIPKAFVSKTNNQEMKIHLINGSIIWVLGSDIDPEKLRGTNPRGIVYCEFAFQDPKVFHVMLPVLRQNRGWMIGQSTYDGMNHFYHVIENNKNNPLWRCRVESIVTLKDKFGNRYITDEMVEEDRRGGMPEYLIQQEYYGNVQINEETRYFAHAIKNIYEYEKIVADLILDSDVYSAWDIGMNDCTAITLFQVKRIDNYFEAVAIGYIESNNHDLNFYVMEVRRFCARYNLSFQEHFLPHDAKNRDFNTGKNTIDFMQDMGENAQVVPKPSTKESAIEAMRRRLYRCRFNKENTTRLMDCLSNYSKEYDEKMGTYKNRPVHNWASHGVDSFQTMTLALDANMISDSCHEIVYYT